MDKIKENGKTLHIISGPTACGKTSLAVELAKYLNTEIVSADSRQIFRELNIGVARPDEYELNAVKHHLIASWSVTDTYNVALYEKQALEIIENLFISHNDVVLCGGSGLYIDAVINGIDDMPDCDVNIRRQVQKELNENGISFLTEELKEKDIAYYNAVDLQNPRRIVRALEVIRQTGKPFSSFRTDKKANRSFKVNFVCLQRDREDLLNRINMRTDKMMQDGLVQEAATLAEFKHLPEIHTVGYRELFDWQEGKHSLQQAVELIKIHTRQYAKRQMTWLRKYPSVKWVNMTNGNIKPADLI
ncbi:MAG: tRNA (adenosine(37)-N6)-dimethylallyltransferase MiaA [Bacteroidales bacterium]|nr:tRNA (adenosine(37)-N6)-dimethylallyltransferase MiaA [Bacteroidales bacterium]